MTPSSGKADNGFKNFFLPTNRFLAFQNVNSDFFERCHSRLLEDSGCNELDAEADIDIYCSDNDEIKTEFETGVPMNESQTSIQVISQSQISQEASPKSSGNVSSCHSSISYLPQPSCQQNQLLTASSFFTTNIESDNNSSKGSISYHVEDVNEVLDSGKKKKPIKNGLLDHLKNC